MRNVIMVMLVIGGLTRPGWPVEHVLLGQRNAVVVSPDSPDAAAGETFQDMVRHLGQAASVGTELQPLTIDYPLDEAVFPPDIAAPTFVWTDPTQSDTWLIEITSADGQDCLRVLTQGATLPAARDDDPRTRSEAVEAYAREVQPVPALRWRPRPETWRQVTTLGGRGMVRVMIVGFHSVDSERCLSRGTVRLSIAREAVEAPIFYRDVPLPFGHVLKNLPAIRWRLGPVSSYRPATLLTGMKVCGNCHSFTSDGKTLAMDVDYGSDKGSYVIADVKPQTLLEKRRVISWSDYRRQDGEPTFGLLSQISPDGRYVISTVKDRSVFVAADDLHYSQRFFPITGILVVYDRRTQKFFSLKGADDGRYVQSNPVWSPDGKTILFARAKCYKLPDLKDPSSALITQAEALEFFEGGKKFRYDLYRVPFNDGQGGAATPLPGASGNGRSNYFPRFSPDGKWIVFCQSDSFMLLRPDSLLYIMPATGGTPSAMRCNFPGKMNSWHSWSPNSRWLVFASKAGGPFTQLWLTHIDEAGRDSPAVRLEHFTAADRAANIPEFVNVSPDQFGEIHAEFEDYYTHYRVGALYEQRHEYGQAVEELRKVLEERPNHVESLYLLASCLARLDREQEALPYAQKAARLVRNSPVLHGLLGGLLSSAGRHGEALTHLEAAYKARPGDVAAASNLAWVLATAPDAAHRDGPRAVELAEWACKVTGHKSPPLLDTLAAAYGEVGQFDRAVRTTQRVIDIVRSNPEASIASLESRLRLYQAGEPYRESNEPQG